MQILIDIAEMVGASLIGFSATALLTAHKLAELRDRLELAASRTAQLLRRNRELNARLAEHQAYRAARSASVAKGNRTRSAKLRAMRAAKTAELAGGK